MSFFHLDKLSNLCSRYCSSNKITRVCLGERSDIFYLLINSYFVPLTIYFISRCSKGTYCLFEQRVLTAYMNSGEPLTYHGRQGDILELETRGNSTWFGTTINSTRSMFRKLWLFEYTRKRRRII